MSNRPLSSRATTAREFLVHLIRDESGRLATYGEIAHLIAYPARSIARILDEIYDDCNAHGEPDITVLVINKSTGLPSKFRERYTVDGGFDHQAWQEEVDAVRAYRWTDQ